MSGQVVFCWIHTLSLTKSNKTICFAISSTFLHILAYWCSWTFMAWVIFPPSCGSCPQDVMRLFSDQPRFSQVGPISSHLVGTSLDPKIFRQVALSETGESEPLELPTSVFLCRLARNIRPYIRAVPSYHPLSGFAKFHKAVFHSFPGYSTDEITPQPNILDNMKTPGTLV